MEEITEVNPAPQMLMETEPEDQSLVEGIILPTHEQMNDQSVLKSVKDVFRGFNFDISEDFGKRFQDTDQLANYVTASMEDIKACRHKAEAADILHQAAAMARFWYMGAALDKALKEGSYGTAACNKLAAALKKSVPYIYQIRAVAERLTVTDAYLLGLRGCDSTTLRRLAQVKDDATRHGIIKAFVDMFKDTYDKAKMEQAKKALIAAINMDQKANFIEVNTSDPTAGGTDILVSDEYQAVMEVLHNMQKLLKKVAGDDYIEKFCSAAANFSILDTVPDAALHLEEVKGESTKTRAILQAAKNNIDDALRELDSLDAVEVLSSESSDSQSSN